MGSFFLSFLIRSFSWALAHFWASKWDTASCMVLCQPDLLEATSSNLSVQMPHAFKEAYKHFLWPPLDLVLNRSCPKSSHFGRWELFIQSRWPDQWSWLWMIIALMLVQFVSSNILNICLSILPADTQNLVEAVLMVFLEGLHVPSISRLWLWAIQEHITTALYTQI